MIISRIKGALSQFVRTFTEAPVYLAYWYEATVVVQNSDGSVDVVPDNQALLGPGSKALRIAMGAPDDTVTLDLTTKPRCLIGFAEGRPDKPFIALWIQGAIAGRTIAGGTNGAARNGDSVSVTLHPADLTTMVLLDSTSKACTATNNVTLTGTITAGSSKVKIG